jgi:hypothetical protein
MDMNTNKFAFSKSAVIQTRSFRDASLAVLPFVLFGAASMLVRTNFLFPYPYSYLNYSYADLAMYVIALTGLFFGLVKGIPRWMYSYLGWSVFFAWREMYRPIDSFSDSPVQDSAVFSVWSWMPLLLVIGMAILFSRSLRPFRQLAADIWQDWTHLSLSMFALIAFFALPGGYDENHHPYLFVFMSATALAICGSVWFFMRSSNARRRSFALAAGMVAAYILILVCDKTWNWWAYHGLPVPAPDPWYIEVFRMFIFGPILAFILFWPLLIGFVQQTTNVQEA